MAIPALRAIRQKFGNAEIIMLCQSWAPKVLKDSNLVDNYRIINVPWTRAADRRIVSISKLIKTTLSLRKEKIDLGIHFRGDPRSLFLMYLSGAKKRISYGEYYAPHGNDWMRKILGRQFLTDIVPIQYKGSHIMDWSIGVAKYLCGENEDINNTLLHISNAAALYVNHFFKKLNIIPDNEIIVGIHPGYGNKTRAWEIEKWENIIKYLQKNKISTRVLVFGSMADKELVDKLVMNNHNVISVMEPLEFLPAFIKLCKLMICLDSSASHIAAAVDTPSVVLFGPNEPYISAPKSDKANIIIKEGFDCRPCLQKGCSYSTDKEIGACMEAISTSDVISKINVDIQSGIIY